MDVGNHFRRTRRFDEAEQWLRKAVARAEESGRIEDQQNPRQLLLETMLQSRNNERFDDAQREVDAYRSLFPTDPQGDLFQGRLHAIRAEDDEDLCSAVGSPEGMAGRMFPEDDLKPHIDHSSEVAQCRLRLLELPHSDRRKRLHAPHERLEILCCLDPFSDGL